MARGVVFQDICPIADGLLVAGERPTVERVRQALGRGSPNTIGPLLDTWWAQLAQRHAKLVALPGIPDDVARAFATAWERALEAGKVHAEGLVAPERVALAEAVAKADAGVADAQAAVTALQAQHAAALADAEALRSALDLREQRLADLERQDAETRAALQVQTARATALEAQLIAGQAEAQRERVAAAAEREAAMTHARQAEDRAYTEIDRLRQELKGLKAQLATQTRENATALRTSEQARRAAETQGQRAEREVAALRGRLQALASMRTRSAPRKRAPAKARKA